MVDSVESVSETEAGKAESAPVESLEVTSQDKDLERLRQENVMLKNRLLLLQADFENFRKRKNEDAERVRKFAAEPVMRALMPALEHFDLALASGVDRKDPAWAEGIDLIARQFAEALRSEGIEEIMPNPGAIFDPMKHEAVERVMTGEMSEGCIAAVRRRGFEFRGRVLKPAQVAVAAAPAENPRF